MLTPGKARCSPSSPCSRPRGRCVWLRAAPRFLVRSSLRKPLRSAPWPCCIRPGRESRRVNRTGKPAWSDQRLRLGCPKGDILALRNQVTFWRCVDSSHHGRHQKFSLRTSRSRRWRGTTTRPPGSDLPHSGDDRPILADCGFANGPLSDPTSQCTTFGALSVICANAIIPGTKQNCALKPRHPTTHPPG